MTDQTVSRIANAKAATQKYRDIQLSKAALCDLLYPEFLKQEKKIAEQKSKILCLRNYLINQNGLSNEAIDDYFNQNKAIEPASELEYVAKFTQTRRNEMIAGRHVIKYNKATIAIQRLSKERIKELSDEIRFGKDYESKVRKLFIFNSEDLIKADNHHNVSSS
uniref:Relaxase n=1 Tax=Rhabditophanes sp. KR3021 TaxID=114890 RepID=A0AC35TQB5_9BILA